MKNILKYIPALLPPAILILAAIVYIVSILAIIVTVGIAIVQSASTLGVPLLIAILAMVGATIVVALVKILTEPHDNNYSG